MENTSPLQMKHTRFFVEDILRPEFGRGNVRSGSPHQPNSPVTPPPSRVEQLPQRDTSLGERLGEKSHLWPAWVFCTRYSDRPSSGPRTRKVRKRERAKDEKRPRTAFTADQLDRLKEEFTETHYLSEERRRVLASQLGLNEAQIKIWFQNKRAKLKKSSSTVNPLAQKLMEEGLYNHSTSNHGNS